jgi:hypothetical protein
MKPVWCLDEKVGHMASQLRATLELRVEGKSAGWWGAGGLVAEGHSRRALQCSSSATLLYLGR